MFVRRFGPVVFLKVEAQYASPESWGTGPLGTVPEGMRPGKTEVFSWSGRDGGSQRIVTVQPSGSIGYSNMGGSQNNGTWNLSGCWMAD